MSVFFPVYNEAEALPGLIDRALIVIDGLGLADFEVIVVDDGSTDGTGDIADHIALRNPRVHVIHHPRNLGYGSALVSGMAAAHYDWTVYTDGDGQFDLADITRFFEATTRVDAVLGFRIRRNDHFGRRFNAWVWGRLVELILGLNVRDLDCGFKLFRTERLHKLGSLDAHGAVISAELILKLKMMGCAWEQVGVEHYPRKGGEPSGARLSVILRAILELIKLRRIRGLVI